MYSIHLFASSIDIVHDIAYITAERMSAFQFTNAYFTTRFVAIYSQQSDGKSMINFRGILADISPNVYIAIIFAWCALVVLFAIIENLRPSSDKGFNWWNFAMSVMPYSNNQAPGLEHSQSISRCVAIITASIFVLLCTTYYQTLLLSNI